MRKNILVSALLVILVSCTMSETRVYSLHMPDPDASSSSGEGMKAIPGGAKAEAAMTVQVGAPKYLTQPYIAYRSSPYQLGISKQAKWDSPPDEMVQAAFRERLAWSGLFKEVMTSSVIPAGAYSLTINLKNFERSDEDGLALGHVAFEVILLSPDGKTLYRNTIVKKTPLTDRIFLSLARGLSLALAEGVAEADRGIEKSVRQ